MTCSIVVEKARAYFDMRDRFGINEVSLSHHRIYHSIYVQKKKKNEWIEIV